MYAFDGLGKALRWIRDKQEKKQYQVAEAAGVTKAMLSAYETGKQKPSIETLEKILSALHVDLADLSNALQVVNERSPLVRSPDAFGGGPSQGELPGAGEPVVDVYTALGLQRPLPPLAEEAMSEMLQGFHKLLRYYYHAIVATVAATSTPKAAPAEAGVPTAHPAEGRREAGR